MSEQMHRYRHGVRKALVLIAVLLILAAAVPIYFRFGWTRMVDDCDLGGPLTQKHLDEVPLDADGGRSVHFTWEWSGGFTCTYSNGHKRQAYWF
jgi:hypothetical protein